MPCLAFFVLGIYSTAVFVSAQDFVINHIDIPNGGTIVGGSVFLSWVNATISDSFVYADHPGSYELMGGPKEASNSPVVDIMTGNEDTSVFGALYTFPTSLSQGQYHFRVNVSNDTVSALSDTFEITAPEFDCLDPPTWSNITSTSDSNYHSLRLTGPAAGYVASIGANKAGTILVGWDYRDHRNNLNAGISKLTLEYISDKTGESTGLNTPSLNGEISSTFDFSGTNVSPGAWRIRANYTNTFEKESPVTYLSEVFYIQGVDGDCEGVGKSSTNGKGSNRSVGRFKELEALWPRVAFVALLFFSL